MAEEDRRPQALAEYRKKLLAHKEIDSKVRSLRSQVKDVKKEYDKTEDDLKALQSVGQIIGEVLRQLDEERCKQLTVAWPILASSYCSAQSELLAAAGSMISCLLALHSDICPCLTFNSCHADIVKASSGPRYVVGCRSKIDKSKLNSGARVALDMTTLTIMRALPREVQIISISWAIAAVKPISQGCSFAVATAYSAICF